MDCGLAQAAVTQGRERMNPKRTIVATLLSVVVLALPAQRALASAPLLSGYGGPGAGEQAIIGAQLVNGPKGGSPPSNPSVTSSSTKSVAVVPSASSPSPEVPPSPTTTAPSTHTVTAQTHTDATPQTKRATPTSIRSTPTPAASQPSAIAPSSYDAHLGLTNGDLLLAAAVFCGLALLGFLTRRLARLQG